MKTKKKAFTLTELLVVVVVIGVLSAVVLPKFSKVIETRRTTEAEELMGAIRTEQEKRCALDKKYLTQLSDMTDIVKSDNTKNYQLALAGTGVTAQRKDNYNYTLEMPSYADGRICCTGDDCGKLNKNYPLCDDLKGTPDYQPSPSSCAGKVSEPEPPTPPTPCEIDPASCECNPNQAKCCSSGTEWNGSACVTPVCNGCSCKAYADVHPEECNTPKKCSEIKPLFQRPCGEGFCGIITVEPVCNQETGEWEESSSLDISGCKMAPKETEERDCNVCGVQKAVYECSTRGTWIQTWGECDMTEEDCKKPFLPATETVAVAGVCSSRQISYDSTGKMDYFPGGEVQSFNYAKEIHLGEWTSSGFGGCTAAIGIVNGRYIFPAFYKSGATRNINYIGSLGQLPFCPAGSSQEALCEQNCTDSSAHSCGFSCILNQTIKKGDSCKEEGTTTTSCSCKTTKYGNYQCAEVGNPVSGSEGKEIVSGSVTTEWIPLIGQATRLYCERAK